jgi:hypothetical protein
MLLDIFFGQKNKYKKICMKGKKRSAKKKVRDKEGRKYFLS